MGLFGPSPDDRVAKALERIATALEVLARTSDIFPQGDDVSSVTYVNDAVEAQKEAIRDAYYYRTGKRLADDESPPPHIPNIDETF